jgi:hypothetical protein
MTRMAATECRDHTTARVRWTGALAAVLLGMTAVVLALTATVFAEPVPIHPSGIATETVVRRFYTAVNVALATGDLAILDDIGALDARLPAESTPLPVSLANLRAAHPNLHFRVERVVADRDADQPLAIASAGHEPMVLDGFRVLDGKIAEVWGTIPGLAAPTPVIRAQLKTIRGPVLAGLVRIDLAPGAETTALSGPGPTAMTVESGALRVLKRDNDVDIPAHLTPGHQLVLDPDASIRLRNEGAERAAVLIAVVFPLYATAPTTFVNAGLQPPPGLVEMVRDDARPVTWPQGMVVQRLFGQPITSDATVPLRLDVERLVLPPGATAASWQATGQGVLAVERGAAIVMRAPDEAAPPDGVAAGGAVALEPGAVVRVRGASDEAAALIVFSLREAPAT